LSAGLVTLFVIQRGAAVHRGRTVVFLGYAVVTALACVAAFLPPGPLLIVVLLLVGFGSLGVFPNYYSFSQELTVRHQGKLTGFLGWSCWMAMGLMQAVVGNVVQAYHSYRIGIAIAGLMPLVGFAALVLLWGKTPAADRDEPPDRAAEPASAPAVQIQNGIQAERSAASFTPAEEQRLSPG
jgi:MFS family permease